MGAFRLGRGEVVRADMTAPARTLFFPFLELILITGVCAIAVGYMDRPGVDWDPILRNAVLVLWAALSIWRFVLPLIRARRQRFMVTNHRVIVRAGRWRARTDSILLRDVYSVRRHRRGISIAIHGYPRALLFPDVPKAKKIVRLIDPAPPAVPPRR